MTSLRLPLALTTAALCCLAGVPSASARLGESREQCALRYGQPVAEVPALLATASGASYQKGDIRIRIEFLEDKASFISFSKRGLRPEERQTLLDLNAGPLVWNPPGEFLGRLCWTAHGNAVQPARHASSYTAAETTYLDLASDEWARSMKSQQTVQFAIVPKAAESTTPATPGEPPVPLPPPGSKLEGF